MPLAFPAPAASGGAGTSHAQPDVEPRRLIMPLLGQKL